MIVVVGATGKTGRRVSARLRLLGERVRPVSRSSAIRFDWSDPDGWDAVLTGATAAYVVAPPVPGPMAKFVERAQALGLRRLVLLSARAADSWEGSAFGQEVQDAERVVRESSLDWTIVRPSNFAQNFDEDIFADPLLRGELALPAGDEVLEPFIDIEDVAAVVAEVLTNPGHEGQTYELTGPRCLTFAEATSLIAAASDRPITYRQVTPEQYTDILVNEGLSREVAEYVVAMFVLLGAIDVGRQTTDDVRRVLGREPATFEDYVVRTAAAGKWRA